MKLLDIVPVTTPGLITPEMEAYINKYLGKDTVMDITQITRGTASIECEYDEAMCAPDIIARCIEAEKAGYEGVFINCFGDPGVRAARECVRIPVFGGFEPVMHLALGLADVVQHYSGSIRIETLFVDEGFTTLDRSSRQSAVDTLLSLGSSGRLVGIISHAEGLREQIRKVLSVAAGPGGSHAAFL